MSVVTHPSEKSEWKQHTKGEETSRLATRNKIVKKESGTCHSVERENYIVCRKMRHVWLWLKIDEDRPLVQEWSVRWWEMDLYVVVL